MEKLLKISGKKCLTCSEDKNTPELPDNPDNEKMLKILADRCELLTQIPAVKEKARQIYYDNGNNIEAAKEYVTMCAIGTLIGVQDMIDTNRNNRSKTNSENCAV